MLDKMKTRSHPTTEQVEEAVKHFRLVIDAAENSNFAGEEAIWKAYTHLAPTKAKRFIKAEIMAEFDEIISELKASDPS